MNAHWNEKWVERGDRQKNTPQQHQYTPLTHLGSLSCYFTINWRQIGVCASSWIHVELWIDCDNDDVLPSRTNQLDVVERAPTMNGMWRVTEEVNRRVVGKLVPSYKKKHGKIHNIVSMCHWWRTWGTKAPTPTKPREENPTFNPRVDDLTQKCDKQAHSPRCHFSRGEASSNVTLSKDTADWFDGVWCTWVIIVMRGSGGVIEQEKQVMWFIALFEMKWLRFSDKTTTWQFQLLCCNQLSYKPYKNQANSKWFLVNLKNFRPIEQW